jgi:O-antigen/teichoic acid export membrane protein
MDTPKRSFLGRLGINVRGDLFASTFTNGCTVFVRLGSSLVLTRLLTPAAYGIFAILLSIVFMIELMSDVGSAGLLIRHPRGDERRFIHALWTIRLCRSTFNFCVMFLTAPIIATIYRTPALTEALRTLSFTFLLGGAESMSYILAQRNKKARIANYTEFACNTVMTVSVIGLAFVLRSAYALIYGFLLQRLLLTISSYFFYRDIGVRLVFDREAFTEQFRFARVVMPSSIITIVLSQYDKLVFLRLFNAALLGVYSVAGNMLGPAKSIIMNNSRMILYARCAEYFRTNRQTARIRYYTENTRLILLGILLPAAVAGLSQSIVSLLYDPRYTFAGYALMVLGLDAMLSAFFNASENLLVASGITHAVLMGNAIRLSALIPASILGYFLFGLKGFLWFNLASSLAPLIYLYWKQSRVGLFDSKIELRWMALGLTVFLVCFTISHIFLALVPPSWLHLHLKRL